MARTDAGKSKNLRRRSPPHRPRSARLFIMVSANVKCGKFNTTGKSLRFYGIQSSPEMKNILRYRRFNQAHNSACPGPSEGRFAVGTKRWAWDAMDAAASGALAPDENAAAYGEIVWSWRRDPGATLAGVSAGNGGKKGRSPGRARISRKAIARGKPGCLGCTCQKPCAFFRKFSHTVLRAQSAPGFPCALSERGPMRCSNPGENESRE